MCAPERASHCKQCAAHTLGELGSQESDDSQFELLAHKGLDLICVPTTAGTGSEVTPIVILSDEKNKLKKGIVSSHLFPDMAILDPELTLGLPPHVTAAANKENRNPLL